MEVIVLEGPAGSGKTTATHALMRVFHADVFKPKLERPRDYKGPALSMVRNYIQATEMLVSPLPMIILDRFWISTFAYEMVRKNENTQRFSDWMDRLGTFLSDMEMDLQRWRATNILNIHWLFVLPKLDQLERQRMESDKTYPFDAGEELGVYHGLFLQMRNRNEISVSTLEEFTSLRS